MAGGERSEMVYATRKFTFSAAHRYWRDEWTAEENARVFGNLTVAHGHNYVLEVTVRGSADALLSLQRRPPAREHGPRRGGERAHLRAVLSPARAQLPARGHRRRGARSRDRHVGRPRGGGRGRGGRGAEPRGSLRPLGHRPRALRRDHDGRGSRPDLLAMARARAAAGTAPAGGGGRDREQPVRVLR